MRCNPSVICPPATFLLTFVITPYVILHVGRFIYACRK